MPMQLTVSRNRKTSENYNSEGYGVSLTVELDQSLLTKPKELQDKIAYLYHEAEAALDKQAQQEKPSLTKNGNGHANGNSNGNSHGMTTAQRRAIQSIGQRLGLDVTQECRHELAAELEQLSVKQANRKLATVYVLKDDLKQLWRYRQTGCAWQFWNQWYSRAIRSRIEPLKSFARRLKGYLPGILSHCRWPLNTSMLEEINNKIKVLKRIAYGYRDDEYLFLKIRGAFPGDG